LKEGLNKMTSLKILDDDKLEVINEKSLDVLQEVGVMIEHEEVYQLLLKAGAKPGQDSNVIKIPRELAAESLEMCPKNIRISDRKNNLYNLNNEGPSLLFSGNALFWSEGKQFSDLTRDKYIDMVRLLDNLENISGVVGTSMSDCIPAARDYSGFRLMLEYTHKHLRPCVYTPQGVKVMIEMAEVLEDSESLKKAPFFSLGYSIISPLRWSKDTLNIFLNSKGYKIPVTINSEPMAGGTAPVTLAGCLVLANADVISGIIVNQLIEEGRPCFYNVGFAHVMDMKTTTALTGAPENALIQAAGAEMARFHKLPSVAWMSTESMVVDSQSMLEKLNTAYAHILSGINVIWGAGNLGTTIAFSPLQAVIDNEIAGNIYRFKEGFEVNEETMAVDLIKEMGFKADYLSTEHTFNHYKKVTRMTDIINRENYEGWQIAGSRTMEEKAQEKLNKILSEEPKRYIDEEQKKELIRIENNYLENLKKK
jgi:trimethylamine---corrinoid protein Co-methyltransferase